MTSSKNSGGFDMFPISSMIGYQFEKQYLSSGDFQALIEFIPDGPCTNSSIFKITKNSSILCFKKKSISEKLCAKKIVH